MEEPVYLTREEAAARARVHVNTIDRAIRAGALQAGGPAGALRIKTEWLDAWMARPRPKRKRTPREKKRRA